MENWIREMLAEAEQYEPCMSLSVDDAGKSVMLILDSAVDFYAEWIPGEGADIGLLRSRDTGKVVGVELPLYRTNLAVHHDGPIRVNDGFVRT